LGRGLGWVTPRGPFPPLPFCDSVILQGWKCPSHCAPPHPDKPLPANALPRAAGAQELQGPSWGEMLWSTALGTHLGKRFRWLFFAGQSLVEVKCALLKLPPSVPLLLATWRRCLGVIFLKAVYLLPSPTSPITSDYLPFQASPSRLSLCVFPMFLLRNVQCLLRFPAKDTPLWACLHKSP